MGQRELGSKCMVGKLFAQRQLSAKKKQTKKNLLMGYIFPLKFKMIIDMLSIIEKSRYVLPGKITCLTQQNNAKMKLDSEF